MKVDKVSKMWKTIKVLAIVILMLAITVSSQRTDIEERYTSYSDMGEYSVIFYDTVGNDSIYVFDSDLHGTHVLLLNGTDRSATFYGNVNVTGNIEPTADLTYSLGNVTLRWKNIFAGSFFGDGGNLTNINVSHLIGNLSLENISVNNITEYNAYGIHFLDQANFTQDIILTAHSDESGTIWGNKSIYIKPNNDNDDFFNFSAFGGIPVLNLTGTVTSTIAAMKYLDIAPLDYLNFKPSHDYNDFFRMKTVGNVPIFMSVGAPLNITGDDDLYLFAQDDVLIVPRDTIDFKPSGDMGDYIRMYTDTNIPHIVSMGATPLNISGSQHLYLWGENDIFIRCRDDLFLTPKSDLFLQPADDIIVTGWGSGTVRSVAGTLYLAATAGNPFNQDLNDTDSPTFVNLTVNENLTVGVDLNVTGNIVGNSYCVEAYFHYHTGTTITFVQDVLYNLTFNATSFMNGFTYDGEANLTCAMPGRYAVNFHADGSGQNNHVYYLSIGINGFIQHNTAVHKKLNSGGDVIVMAGTGFVNLTNGDVVSLMVRDITGGGAGTYYAANLNLVRIGDI